MNIKCSPRKRWFTPNINVALKNKFPTIGYKGVIPSVPQKQKSGHNISHSNSISRDCKNYTTLLELNKNNVHNILEKIRLSNRWNGVKTKRIHCLYKGKRSRFLKPEVGSYTLYYLDSE